MGMLSLLGSVLAATSMHKGYNRRGVNSCIGKNELSDKIILTAYPTKTEEADLPKQGVTPFKETVNLQYQYALAFCNGGQQSRFGPDIAFVYIKVDVQKLVPPYNNSRNAPKTSVDL